METVVDKWMVVAVRVGHQEITQAPEGHCHKSEEIFS